MRRKTFDALMTTGGLVLAAVLIVAGVLGLWAHNFIDNQVKTPVVPTADRVPGCRLSGDLGPRYQAVPDQVRRRDDDQRRAG